MSFRVWSGRDTSMPCKLTQRPRRSVANWTISSGGAVTYLSRERINCFWSLGLKHISVHYAMWLRLSTVNVGGYKILTGVISDFSDFKRSLCRNVSSKMSLRNSSSNLCHRYEWAREVYTYLHRVCLQWLQQNRLWPDTKRRLTFELLWLKLRQTETTQLYHSSAGWNSHPRPVRPITMIKSTPSLKRERHREGFLTDILI